MKRKPFAPETRTEAARCALAMCGIPVGADYHKLRSVQVDALIEWADFCRYRKPRNTNGSRGRHFHALLQRWATEMSYSEARKAFREARRVLG